MSTYQGLLLLHIAAGFTALLAGAVSMLAKKGRRWHSRAGRSFFYCMQLVVITSLLMCLLKWNSFLLHIGLFTLYMNVAGYRSVKKKSLRPDWQDWLVLLIAAANSLLMLASMQAVLMVFGGLCAVLVSKDLQMYYWLARGKNLPGKLWLVRHLSMMLATYIATFTAFLVVNIQLPNYGWIVWLAPSAVIAPLINYWVRRIEQPVNHQPAGSSP